VEDVVGEALPGKITGRLCRRATAGDDALGALGLAPERVDYLVQDARLHAGERELVSYALVPRPALRERESPREGITAVVDEGGADEPVDNVLTLDVTDPAALEKAIDLGCGAIAVTQRTKRLLERCSCGCRRVSSRREPPLRPR
jgi:hypothetical protein